MSNDLEHKHDISVARYCKGLTKPKLSEKVADWFSGRENGL